MAERLYTLLTGNVGMFEAFVERPPMGTGWKVQCELDPDEKVPDNEGVLLTPEGNEIFRSKLTPGFKGDMQAQIKVDMTARQGEASGQPQASQHQGMLPDAPAARSLYKGTSGHKVAAQMLKRYDDPAEPWSLEIEYYQGFPTGHVQLLDVDGTTVIGSGAVLPINTLVSRIADAVRTFRAGVLGAAPEITATPGSAPQEWPADPAPVEPEQTVAASAQPVEATPPADVPYWNSPENVGPPNWFRPGKRVRTVSDDPAQAVTGTVEQVAGSFADIRRDDGKGTINLEYLRVLPVVDDAPAAQPLAEPAPSAAEPPEKTAQPDQGMKQPEIPAAATRPVVEIPISEIGHFPGGNVRETFTNLDELAADIRRRGIKQPLTVNEIDGHYTLLAGERRMRAAGQAGLPTVPCLIEHMSQAEALEWMLVENIQREDLNPVEEARAYQRLLKIHGDQGRVAQAVGKSRPHVVERLQLLQLPPDLQYQVATGVQSVKNGLAFLRQTKEAPPEAREKVAETLAAERPTSREAPKVIDRVLEQQGVARATPPKQEPKAEPPAAPPNPPASPARTQPVTPPAPAAEQETEIILVTPAVKQRLEARRGVMTASKFLTGLMDDWEA